MAVKSPHGECIGKFLDSYFAGKVENFAEIGVWKGHMYRYIFRNFPKLIKTYYAIDQWNILEDTHGRMGKSRMSLKDWEKLYWRCCADMYYFPELRTMRITS